MRVSIFGKLIVRSSLLLLLMLGSGGYIIFTLNSVMTRATEVLTQNQRLLGGIRLMQVDFTQQGQEWKNILLRGHDPADFEEYQQSLRRYYDLVQQHAADMQGMEISKDSLKALQQFIIEHQQLQLAYLKGLRLLKADNAHDVQKVDLSVRGQARAPSELLDSLAERIQLEAQAESDAFQQQTTDAERRFLSLFGLAIVLSLLIAFVTARKLSAPLREISNVLQEVAGGNVQVECALRSKDEIGNLANSARDMIAYVQQVASVTEQVAGGELDIELNPKSERDVLNHSLLQMLVNLREMREEIQDAAHQAEEQYTALKEQSWSKDGLSQLSASLAGSHSPAESCRIAIRTVARYVKAGQGVVYLYNAEEEALSLQGSFAFTERDGLSRHYALGENVIGQVAQERKPILLTHAGREERVINSALISQAPLNTYAFPLVYNDELYGVAELAFFHAFETKDQEFLTQAARMIATAVFSAQQHTRNEGLLRQAEQAAQKAETAQVSVRQQAEEAQQANVLLEEQQQQLQQQNEEFQQMTAQLQQEKQERLRQSDEQAQLEQHLEQERRLLRNLIDNLPDYVYAKNTQSQFILANQPLARSAGFSRPEELLGKTDFDLQPKALAETYYRAEQDLMRSGEEIREREETFEQTDSGEKIWLLSSKIPFHDRQGNVVGFIGIGRNITEYKRTLDALRQLQKRSAHVLQVKEELEQRVRELESA